MPETPLLARRSFTRNSVLARSNARKRLGVLQEAAVCQRRRQGHVLSPLLPASTRRRPPTLNPAGPGSGQAAATPPGPGRLELRRRSPTQPKRRRRDQEGDAQMRSPGGRGSALQRDPESAGQGAVRRGCRERSANYLGHVTRPPASARPRDFTRRDVSTDAPPNPCPAAGAVRGADCPAPRPPVASRVKNGQAAEANGGS